MRKFRAIKTSLVPVLFTEHQFQLIENKMSGKKLTPSEKNEFSRAVSKKMNAINKILEKETGGVFIYGKEKILPKRLVKSEKYIKDFSRKFKNKHVLISGSFLHAEKYNDIDVFVISKYDKNDFHEGNFHINYLTEDVYNSLFFASLKKMCISNKKIEYFKITEKINLDTFISTYQELFNDLNRNFKLVKTSLRDFLLQASYLSKKQIIDSCDIKQQIAQILRLKRPKEIIKKIFVEVVVLGFKVKEALKTMKEMTKKYAEIMEEYSQHRNYYKEVMQPFQEVVSIES